MGYLARNWRAEAAAHSPSVWYHEGSSLSDSGMMERFRFNGGMSAEGSWDTGTGEGGGSVGVFWLVAGEAASVLDLLTGLRENRDFLEDLRGEGSIRETGLASTTVAKSILHLI